MRSISRKKQRTGIVISDKMNKTIVVKIDNVSKHPVYGRIVKRSAKVMVHDEKKKARTGDIVKIEESRPISKNKKWCLIELLK